MHNIDHVEPYQGASITQRETYATCDDFMFVAPIKYTQHLSCPTKLPPLNCDTLGKCLTSRVTLSNSTNEVNPTCQQS